MKEHEVTCGGCGSTFELFGAIGDNFRCIKCVDKEIDDRSHGCTRRTNTCALCRDTYEPITGSALETYCPACHRSVLDERTALLRATFNKYGHPVQLASAIASGSPVDFDASDPLGFWSVRMLRAMGHLNVNAVRKENG